MYYNNIINCLNWFYQWTNNCEKKCLYINVKIFQYFRRVCMLTDKSCYCCWLYLCCCNWLRLSNAPRPHAPGILRGTVQTYFATIPLIFQSCRCAMASRGMYRAGNSPHSYTESQIWKIRKQIEYTIIYTLLAEEFWKLIRC